MHGQLPADLQFTYEFYYQGSPVPAGGTIQYTPSQPVALQVYLRQTSGSASFVADHFGLYAAGVRLDFPNPAVAGVAAAGDIAPNPQFTGTPTLFLNGTTSAYLQSSFDLPPDSGVQLAGDPQRVLIGTFLLHTGAGGNTVLTAGQNPGANYDDFITIDGETLDSTVLPVTTQVSLTPVPVPEPATVLGVAGLGLVAFGMIRRGRKRRMALVDRPLASSGR